MKFGGVFEEKLAFFTGMVLKSSVPHRKFKIFQKFFLKVSRYIIWKRLNECLLIFEHFGDFDLV